MSACTHRLAYCSTIAVLVAVAAGSLIFRCRSALPARSSSESQ
jgi:hypothetical protein